jgi:hypothetical protein
VDDRWCCGGNLRRAHLVLQDVIDDTIRYTPSNEIELSDGCRKALKFYTLGPAKRIKQLLAVAVKTALVGYMYSKGLATLSGVSDVAILGIIRHKPFKAAKRNSILMCKDVTQLISVFGLAEETRERFEEQI